MKIAVGITFVLLFVALITTGWVHTMFAMIFGAVGGVTLRELRDYLLKCD